MFRVNDTYTAQTGFNVTNPSLAKKMLPLKVSELSIEAAQITKTHPEADKRWLHMDDNNTVLVQYNDEKSVADYYRTRPIPECKARELAAFHSLAVGVHSESFYRQFETLADGIVDFKSEEKAEQIEQYIRVRTCEGKNTTLAGACSKHSTRAKLDSRTE